MSENETAEHGAGTVYFDAELRPHRSLGPSGFLIVMAVATGFGFVIGVSFMMVGAWPVLGFCGLEIALLYGAFRLNYRAAKRRERVRLTDRGLQITYLAPSGRMRIWETEPSWLRIEEENPRRRAGWIKLSSHGRSTTIGRFLTPVERAEIASALRDAVMRYRSAPQAPC